MKPDNAKAYELLHQGALALSRMECEGMRIDTDYLDKAIDKVGSRITKLRAKLRASDTYTKQRRLYGAKTNVHSRDQLARVLFAKDSGHKAHAVTKTGKPKLDETALEKVDTPYTRRFIELEKMSKLHGTFLLGIKSEVSKAGRCHGFFNLNTVRSYRGSADSPNLQTMPIRDPLQSKIIRRAFVPDPGCMLVEIDYSSLEVMVACALSGDERLTFDAVEGDMHRDMGAECFMLTKDQVSKQTRQATKGGFVFAEFYGDWYKQVTKNLWESITRDRLSTADDKPLLDHLAAKGVTERGACNPKLDPVPGTFEAHIKKTEDRFWNERFLTYHKWRQAQVAKYQQTGQVHLATGFTCRGPMSKNQIINYPIQGPSFHCLLWSLTRLTKLLAKAKMKTKIVLQVHDSILANVAPGELEAYLTLARQVMTVDVAKRFPWLTVPLSIEAEGSDKNWHEKRKLELP